MPLLFSYGTLQHEEVQVSTFGRKLAGEKDLIVGYEPSAFFLARNAQQEVNLHNLAGSSLRQVAVALALGGLGLVLPLALRTPGIRQLGDRVGLSTPLPFAPLFVGALALQLLYPVAFTGEIVELLVSVALTAFAGSWLIERYCPGAWLQAGVLVLGLGVALGAASSWAAASRGADPRSIVTAAAEVEALAVDLLAGAKLLGAAPTRCGAHSRLHNLASSRAGAKLLWSRFTANAAEGKDRERVASFLDPWSSSYWVRDHCQGEQRSVFVYSLGPNRRRDSSESMIGGDDIGAYLLRPAASP